MPIGYDNNGAVIENEAAVVKYVFDKFNEYAKNPPADMVEDKIEAAREIGEEITYEEAAKRVTVYEIECRIWDEIRSNPQYAEAIIQYNRRIGVNTDSTKIIGQMRKTAETHQPVMTAEDFAQVQEKLAENRSPKVAVYRRSSPEQNPYSPVVIYARESNHEGADECLDRQRERLKDFCAARGYDIADEVFTIGSREDSIPALKKAIEYAQTTESRTILMASSNRVIGTAAELKEIAELINQSGVIIQTMDGSYEMATQYSASPEMLIAQTLADVEDDIDDDFDEDEGMGGMSL